MSSHDPIDRLTNKALEIFHNCLKWGDGHNWAFVVVLPLALGWLAHDDGEKILRSFATSGGASQPYSAPSTADSNTVDQQTPKPSEENPSVTTASVEKAVSGGAQSVTSDRTSLQQHVCACEDFNAGTDLIDGPHADPLKALDFLIKAYRHGDTDAATNIAYIYSTGKLGKPDLQEALRWDVRAISGGDKQAEYNYAIDLENSGASSSQGNESETDQKAACYWLSKSAHQGYADARKEFAENCAVATASEVAPTIPEAQNGSVEADKTASQAQPPLYSQGLLGGMQGRVAYSGKPNFSVPGSYNGWKGN